MKPGENRSNSDASKIGVKLQCPGLKRFSFQHGQVEFEGRKWVDPRVGSNGLHWSCQFVCPSLAHGLNKLISRNPLCVFYTGIRDDLSEGFDLFLHIVAAI